MPKEQLLESMPKRNSQGDRSVCIGAFTIDYSKEQDKFYLVYPNGHVREIDADTAKRYMGVE